MRKFMFALVALFVASQLLVWADETKYEHVFIELKDGTSINDLVHEGVKPECVFGNIITAKVPKHKKHKINAKSIAPGRLLMLCNDSARRQCNVDILHHPSVGRPEGYTGKGVIVGIIDCGIDFNHIEFKDAQGNCRIKRAYLPEDTTQNGHIPVIEGLELPGREYITSEEILTVGTDALNEFHGTHTTGTAAGSYMGNKYYGVAPEAELVLCAMPPDKLTEVNIMNSIKYIFSYADEVGMPAVINMSLASTDGPHDGTTKLPRLIDEISDKGKICVVSAGNFAHYKAYIEKQFENKNDTLRTFLEDAFIKNQGISIWHKGEKPASVRFVFVDHNTKQVTYRSKVLSTQITDEEGDTIKTHEIIDTTKIKVKGEIIYAVRKNDLDGKFGVDIVTNFTFSRGQYVGIEIAAEPGTFLQAWNIGGKSFLSYGIEKYSDGLYRSSINDMATGDRMISVGAFHSRDSVVRDDGKVQYFKQKQCGDIAYFSSFGPDANGIDRPTVVASGFMLGSGYNGHINKPADTWVHNEEIDGVNYSWCTDGGTSMSAPIVSGTIALWLQEKPDLTPEEVMYVLQKSCVRDKFVQNEPHKWGCGKLNAAVGMEVVKQLVAGVNNISDNEPQFIITGNDITILTDESVSVFSISGRLVATFSQQGTYSTQSWQPGIYIIKTKTTAKKFVR